MISVILICASLLLALFICVKMVGGKSLDRITARTVGHGQHGTARWANRREIRKYYTLVPYEVEAWRKGEHRPEHSGFVLGTYHRGRKLIAWVDASDSHAMMIASPGGGKTAYLLHELHYSVLLINPPSSLISRLFIIYHKTGNSTTLNFISATTLL